MIRSRLTYANLAATIAVFFALAGTSYALIVTGELVKDESLTGADVRNGSLGGADVDEASLATVPTASSVAIAEDSKLLDGLDSTAFVRDHSAHRAAGAFDSVSRKRAGVVCPPGKRLVGGGGSVSGGLVQGPDGQLYTKVAITSIEHANSGHELLVWAAETEPTDVNWAVIAEAICARVD